MALAPADLEAGPMLRRARPVAASAVGFGAILLWSVLATLTVMAGPMPPFELTGLTCGIGGVLGLVIALVRGRGSRLRPPTAMLFFGVSGLFGHYVLYFGALQLAPTAQASLIVQLWPLMMVLLAALTLKERLSPHHVFGLALGLAAIAVLTTCTSARVAFEFRYLPGYLMALAAAIVWAGYSVLSRRFSEVPTEAIATICLATAGLAGVAHWILEPTTALQTPQQTLAILAIGLGPSGGAFFLWDHGIKHGNVRTLATLGLAAPVLSVLTLVTAGIATPSPALDGACALVALAGLSTVKIPIGRGSGVRRARMGVPGRGAHRSEVVSLQTAMKVRRSRAEAAAPKRQHTEPDLRIFELHEPAQHSPRRS